MTSTSSYSADGIRRAPSASGQCDNHLATRSLHPLNDQHTPVPKRPLGQVLSQRRKPKAAPMSWSKARSGRTRRAAMSGLAMKPTA